MSDIDLFARQENEVLKKEKHELQHKIIDLRQSKDDLEQENKQLKEEYKKVRDELLQYEIQNSKLQKELVELRVNTGRSVILGDKENE